MSTINLLQLPLMLDRVPPGVRRALAQEGVPTADIVAGGEPGRFVLFDSRLGRPHLRKPGQVAIDLDAFRRGMAVDPMAALVDTKACRAEWELDGWTVAEEVSRHDKRAIRQRLIGALRQEIEARGGVWIRLAPFPAPYRSAFNFRIDHDEYDREDFQATLRALDGFEDATSHFVNAATHASEQDALDRLRGLDVGSHGYWHHTYRTVEENRRNIARGVEFLEEAGLAPSGFTAPHGRYHAELQAAVDLLGIGHGSEFGLCHDDLPFFVGEKRAVQIPIHPICLGLFLEASDGRPASKDAAARAIRDHFVQYAEARHAMGEPIFLYGHPTERLGRYPHVLRETLKSVAPWGDVWHTTMTRMAQWWRARSRVVLTVAGAGNRLRLAVKNRPRGDVVAVQVFRGGRVASLPIDRDTMELEWTALRYETLVNRPLPEAALAQAPEGWKQRVQRILDWERVTPVEEIPHDSWRNTVKATLRRIA